MSEWVWLGGSGADEGAAWRWISVLLEEAYRRTRQNHSPLDTRTDDRTRAAEGGQEGGGSTSGARERWRQLCSPGVLDGIKVLREAKLLQQKVQLRCASEGK